MTPSALAKKLLHAAEAAVPEANSLLSDLIRFPTVNSRNSPEEIARCRAEIKRCFAYLSDWAKKNGFAFRNYDDLVCVLELPGETDETIGVALHADVVPAEGQWDRPPFSGDIVDGWIWGRGSQDNKGGTAQMLTAAKIIRDAGVPLKRKLKLIVGSTEETGEWECMKRYHQEEPDPSFTVVPDAEFPIISGEKGFVTLILEGRWQGAAPVRPGGLRFVSLKAGHTENIIPDQADLLVAGDPSAEDFLARTVELFGRGRGRTAYLASEAGPNPGEKLYRIKILGRAVHSSTPRKGLNAALDGLELALILFGDGETASRVARWLFRVGNDPSGKEMGIAAEHHFVGATTLAPTVLELRPESLDAQINIRCAFGQTTAQMAEKTRESLKAEPGVPDIGVRIKKGNREPIYVDAEQFSAQLEALKKSYSDVQGRPAKLLSIGGTTYAKAFGRAVCFGPVDKSDGEPEVAHQVNERIKVEHQLRNLKIYTLALARLVSADPAL
jgi:succinyl-diaminopimelate desuccinylase